MSKGDVIGWAAILGGIALAGFLGYRAIRGVLTGGNLSLGGILGIGGGAGDTDIFGNPTVASVERKWQETYQASSERNANFSAGLALIDTYDYGPELEAAYRKYVQECQDYDVLEEQWRLGGYPKYGFWTGKEDPETTALRMKMEKEAAEANLAREAYIEVRGNWMAQNA